MKNIDDQIPIMYICIVDHTLHINVKSLPKRNPDPKDVACSCTKQKRFLKAKKLAQSSFEIINATFYIQ